MALHLPDWSDSCPFVAKRSGAAIGETLGGSIAWRNGDLVLGAYEARGARLAACAGCCHRRFIRAA